MGIYYKDHECGCVTACSTYGNGAWLHKPCSKHEADVNGLYEEIKAEAVKAAETRRREEDMDLCLRLGLTPERLAELRDVRW